MKVLVPQNWQDYEFLDSGDGRRLERYAKYILNRPDPQAIWQPSLSEEKWHQADFSFENDKWIGKTQLSEKWEIIYRDLRFYAKLTPFKHTGIFPEQAVHWDWLSDTIQSSRLAAKRAESRIQNKKPDVLNLFGYTGIASLVCAKAGAEVTHVDASYRAIGWARENQKLANLSDRPIRWIEDDVIKFVEREVRRGKKYDGMIMDPPVFGHGPKGETWDFLKSFPSLMEVCKQLLSDKPLFFLINAYAVSVSAIMLNNVLEDTVEGFGGSIEYGELALQEKERKRLLSTGIFARWSNTR